MSSMEWTTAKLVEIAAPKRWALNGGPFGSKLSSKHYVESGIPVIRGTNLSGHAKFSFEDFVYVTEQKADELRANNAQPGDLIFTQRGTIGQVGLIPMDSPIRRFVISQSQMKLTVNPERADATFLYYFFSAANTVRKIQNLAFAAGVPHINLDILRKFEVPVPALATQRRIAAILSGYDELIENSQRRIRILETMARSLYREWFVDFRFPGHENVRRVPSALGEIPEGWDVKNVGDVAQTFRGCSYRSVDLAEEGGLAFLNLKCLDRDGGFRRSGLKRFRGKYKDIHVARKGDIVMAVTDMTQDRRIVARAAIVPSLDKEVGVFSMDLVRIEPRAPMSKPFLYSFLRNSGFSDEVKQHANGVNVLHLAPERITDFRFVVPAGHVIQQFAAFYTPVLEEVDTLENEVANLRLTRDLLLPRLVSGQINLEAI
jgi:type I restriction enzyme S subunit